MKNPYLTKPGFGFRVVRAQKWLTDYGYYRIGSDEKVHSRAMDNCFEMFDGTAIVWALMDKAQSDEYLMHGIKRFMGQGFDNWQDVYSQRKKYVPAMQDLFKVQS